MQQSTRQRALKPCHEIGCGNLTRSTYCKEHEKVAQETTRNYNRFSRDKITEQFYHSTAWRKVRLLALERDNFLCVDCRSRGTLTKADVVHHIVEIKEDWSLRLSLDNLKSLCHGCHNRHHKRHPAPGFSEK